MTRKTRIESNTFAEACYDQNSAYELETALEGPPDEADMEAWELTADEWRLQINLALLAKYEDARE